MSGHIFTIGFSYGNKSGSKKAKRVKKTKPEIHAFLSFLPFLLFLLPSRLSLQDLTL
jgi:hypothetical protein